MTFYNIFRLSLAQLLEEIEREDFDSAVDIYAAPPKEGDDTDCDSDTSDQGAGNLNHLGPRMLTTECEYVIIGKQNDDSKPSDEEPMSTFALPSQFSSSYDDFNSSDDEPLSKLVSNYKTGTCFYSEHNPLPPSKKMRCKSTAKNVKSKKSAIVTKWEKTLPKFDLNTICGEKPPSEEASMAKTPMEFFQLFFTEDLISKILDETNKYGLQKNNHLGVKVDELYTFLGGLLLSGYGKYPNKRMYWSNQDDVPKILQNSIRLNRFESILRSFHLNDNTVIDKEDRLYKLRPLITHLNQNFQKHGGLKENISIDESMIPYYGRHYAKQYIKGKPIRFGFKNWALCNNDGYLVSFDIYTGKSNKENVFGIGGDTVLSLIMASKIPPNQGYKLFFDNYFSSVSLFRHLTQLGYCATGTIRDNRVEKCPLTEKSKMEKLERGSYDFRSESENEVCLVRWKDNKVVTCATNFDSIAEGKCYRWSKGSKGKIAVVQPVLFQKYNNGMGGVDKMDQLVASYRTRMRQRKWWWPICCYLLDVSVTNAWLLMKRICPTEKDCESLMNFRRNLANCLLKTYGTPSMKGKIIQNPVNDVRYDGRDHWPDYVNTERLCRYCGGKSKFICSKCQVGLHPKHCFKNYHTF